MRGVVRVKDGPTLRGGDDILLSEESDADGLGDPELEAFAASVLGRAASTWRNEPEPPKPVHFLLYAPEIGGATAPQAAGYGYDLALDAFATALTKLGAVHILRRLEGDVDRLYADCVAKGETCLILSFAPPHETFIGLRCPIVPMVAWGFPTIPQRVWADDRRHDWRFVLRQTGRAIALSSFALRAVQQALGQGFSVGSAAPPIWDRFNALHKVARRAVDEPADLSVEGAVFDTTGRRFGAEFATPSLASERQRASGLDEAPPDPHPHSAVRLTGVIFAGVITPSDKLQNWGDLLTAFIAAHRDHADATLVLWMRASEPRQWWWELHNLLNRQLPFSCRVVVLEGNLSDQSYRQLICCAHWIVSAALAEGLCVPIMSFMSAGRPAISPSHTAVADFISSQNALIVESGEEYCAFPHDPTDQLTATRHRPSWDSLVARLSEGYSIVVSDPDRYDKMAGQAHRTLGDYCSDEIVLRQLASFLGLEAADGIDPLPPPSPAESAS
jgi:hypothetical protein